MAIARGTRFGSYEVAALVGVGGMGEVYRATDLGLKRDVALKVLPEELLTDANRLARLQREAELLASLNHANVAQIHGLERSEGRTALVMELVDGITLAERIAQGPLPSSEALNVAMQIAAALEAAHTHGIVHRDLKPANIKLNSEGTVKVLDFGLAKALDLRATSGPPLQALTTPAMTEAGVVLGTAAYMSPEQARGKAVDKRADIWAFGCVLYEMLSGRAAFLGEDPTSTLARVLERDPDMRPLPAGLSPGVRRTLELCLQKDVKERLHDIGDVRLALKGALVERVGAPTRPPWRRALPIAAAVVTGALLAGVYMASLVQPAAPPALPVTRFVITPPATAPLASLGGYDVAISPDGKRLVYVAQTPENGGGALYVRELNSLEVRRIPGTEVANLFNERRAAGNMNPFFSADGNWIGFFIPGRGVIRAGLDGTPPIKLLDTRDFLGAALAPNDTLIISSGNRLERVSAGGGTPELLASEEEPIFFRAPASLPGGRAVLFVRVEDGVAKVAVLDLETGEHTILIEGAQKPAYAATGHIVFARGTTLMAVPFDAAELALTGEPEVLVAGVRRPGPGSAPDYALSASGTLAYVPADVPTDVATAALVWVDRTGAAVGRAVSELVDAPRDPRLSPDGQRLVLTTGGGGARELWSYDLRGRPAIPLSVTNDSHGAVWSPDGGQVAFLSGALRETEAIYTLPTDGSVLAPQRLATEGALGIPTVWATEGEVLFDTFLGDIKVAPAAAAGEVRDVVATEYDEFDAALSPNGRWLAYASDRTGQNQVWIQGYPEGVPVRVSRNGGYEPHWSADGRELFFLQGNSMMAVAVEIEPEFSFAAPVLLFSGSNFTAPGPGAGSYDVARDGRFLMIQPDSANATGGSSSIVVVQNWFEELKQRVPVQR